jgi:hypothetical protein
MDDHGRAQASNMKKARDWGFFSTRPAAAILEGANSPTIPGEQEGYATLLLQ